MGPADIVQQLMMLPLHIASIYWLFNSAIDYVSSSCCQLSVTTWIQRATPYRACQESRREQYPDKCDGDDWRPSGNTFNFVRIFLWGNSAERWNIISDKVGNLIKGICPAKDLKGWGTVAVLSFITKPWAILED